MFARMQYVCALLLATGMVINTGCQTTGDAQQNTVLQQQSPAKPEPAEVEMHFPSARIEARTHLAAARLHEGQNNLMLAIQQYQRALAADPGNVQILLRMGVLNDRLGNSAAAGKNYLEALNYQPDNPQIHNNLGFSYILRQRWDDAQSALQRAIELNPEFARARTNLALVLAQRGQFEDAHRQFLMVLPTDEAWYNLGLMYQSKRKTAEAAEAYQRALRDNPQLTAAAEQLKLLPNDVVATALLKLEEEDRQKLAELEAPASTQPADVQDATADAPSVLDELSGELLSSMTADDPFETPDPFGAAFFQSKSDKSKEVAADSEEPVPSLGARVVRQLEDMLSPWQQTPELVQLLSQELAVLASSRGNPHSLEALDLWNEWHDESPWQAQASSPEVTLVSLPETAADRPELEQSSSPK